MSAHECGSCGAVTDSDVAEPGDLYHDPDEDCRAVRVVLSESEKIEAGLLEPYVPDYMQEEL